MEVTLLLEFRLKAALGGIQPGSELGDPQGEDRGCLSRAGVHSCAGRSWAQTQFLGRKSRFESETCGQNLLISWLVFSEGSGMSSHVCVFCMSLTEVDPRAGEGPWTGTGGTG